MFRTDKPPSITDALAMWSEWHADISPMGPTGDFALDMQLADAFRALVYRPVLKDRLTWIERELRSGKRRRPGDDRYHAAIISWWLELYGAEKAPVIENRMHERELQCASF